MVLDTLRYLRVDPITKLFHAPGTPKLENFLHPLLDFFSNLYLTMTRVTFYYCLILASEMALITGLLIGLGLGVLLAAAAGDSTVVLDGRPHLPSLTMVYDSEKISTLIWMYV